MAKEKTRLEPKDDTLREIYLKSGNLCAFPRCEERMMNLDGVFIGQVCHIEAAEDGGPRFNKAQSREDRRHVSNLMLMCYKHHKITDDTERYPVGVLNQMKADHEKKFSDVVEKIRQSIVDVAAAQPIGNATSLKKINDLLWKNTPEQLQATLALVNKLAFYLHRLPERTRELLTVMVNRSNRPAAFEKRHALHHEIAEACNLSDREVMRHVTILAKYDFAEGYQDGDGVLCIEIMRFRDWDVWQDLKSFCKAATINLRDIIVGLDFHLLD